MIAYTQPLETLFTINDDPATLVINGRPAFPTTLVLAETYANGTLNVSAQNALRERNSHQRKVATVYHNGYWFLLTPDGAMQQFPNESAAIAHAVTLAA